MTNPIVTIVANVPLVSTCTGHCHITNAAGMTTCHTCGWNDWFGFPTTVQTVHAPSPKTPGK